MEDCLLLYLLIRRFERRFAFEIGTYVGTTSVCMNEAVRHNGGVLTTCDPIDYAALSPWSGIRFIRGNGSAALALLHDEGHRIDFAFIDWTPDEATMRRLNEMCTEDAVLAVHDYGPDLKGKTTVEMLENFYVHATAGRWFLPDAAPVTFSDGMRVNYCTAFFIPYHLLGSVKLGLTA
jgi:hypothetical protein